MQAKRGEGFMGALNFILNNIGPAGVITLIFLLGCFAGYILVLLRTIRKEQNRFEEELKGIKSNHLAHIEKSLGDIKADQARMNEKLKSNREFFDQGLARVDDKLKSNREFFSQGLARVDEKLKSNREFLAQGLARMDEKLKSNREFFDHRLSAIENKMEGMDGKIDRLLARH